MAKISCSGWTTKDFYCSICLETFPAGKGPNDASKDAMYLKFVRLIGKYLGLESFKSVEKRLRQEEEANYKTDISSSLKRSLCHQCGDSVDHICKLLAELELLEIKLNNAISIINREAFEGNELSRRRSVLVKRLGGVHKLKNIIIVSDGIARKRNRFLVPQVVLNPMKTQAELNGIKTKTVEYSTKKIITPGGTRNASGGTLIYGRTSSLLNMLGFENGNIVSCDFCEKFCYSNEELQQHKESFHSITKTTRSASKIQPFSKVTPSKESSAMKEHGVFPDRTTINAEKDGLGSVIADKNNFGGFHDENEMDLDDGDEGFHVSTCPSPSAPEDGGPPSDSTQMLIPEGEVKVEPDEDSTLTQPSVTPIEVAGTENVEIKQEDSEKMNTAPPPPRKKVPFMSSEYLGKYKVVCKLMNIKTGETCVGVVAKTPTVAANDGNKEIISASGDTNRGGKIPKVISIGPDVVINPTVRKSKITDPVKSDPPNKCPFKSSKVKFKKRSRCKQNVNSSHVEMTHQKMDTNKANTSSSLPSKKPKGGESGFSHRCEVVGCLLRFQSKDTLHFHHQTKHTPLSCHFCSEILPNLVELVSHEVANHQQSQTSSRKPSESDSSSLPDPNTIQSCPRCGQSVSAASKKGLKTHYAHIHYKFSLPKPLFARPFCGICNLTINPIQKYVQHMIQVHGDEGKSVLDRELPHKCGTCEKRFRFQINLRQHQQLVHEGGGKGQRQKHRVLLPQLHCHICGKIYKTGSQVLFENHMKMHAMASESKSENGSTANAKKCLSRKIPWDKVPSKEGFVCDVCGKVFPVFRYLRFHLSRSHHKPQTPCPICGKGFPGQGLARYHIRRVHPEEAFKYELQPGEGFVCHQCGRAYARGDSLKRHLARYCLGSSVE